MEAIVYQPIGIISSPYRTRAGMPIQAAGARGIRGTIKIFPEFGDGLKDLGGFSHIILLYHFHRTQEKALVVTPFLDDQPRGVFATRSPNHPNAIGISIVRLLAIEGLRLSIEDVDILDGTPLLDIKPYVPAFDQRKPERVGWLEKAQGKADQHRADERFK
ncbi:MAG: tRNA (N6-threonylcarbamoyladenosine(37)-N6)-methyltransferase TrmO [Desulfobacterales bacterium]|nr:tRNA (N6-threonylcarbamoyladenosine(37)-N6)-methyltransferase TrmO [Desulfobacterales bacterium]